MDEFFEYRCLNDRIYERDYYYNLENFIYDDEDDENYDLDNDEE